MTEPARVSPIALADLDLARRCVAGERLAQRELFRTHRQRIHRILFRVLGTNREIEDLVQEASLAVFRSLGNFRGEASLATWVDRIATRVAFRYLSERRRSQPLPPEAFAVESEDPERKAYLSQVARSLYSILERLDAKYRVAFALAVIDGRTIEEVADLTGVSVVAAKNRVWRARNMVDQRAEHDRVLMDFLARRQS